MRALAANIAMLLVLAGTIPAAAASDWATCAGANHIFSKPIPTVDEVQAACSRLIKSGGKKGRELAIVYVHRCWTWQFKRDPDQASADCDQAIQLDPKNADAYAARCRVRTNRNDLDRALADCSEAIQLDPEMGNAWRYRCLAWIQRKDFEQALADCNQAVRFGPRNIFNYIDRATTFRLLGDYERAIADYDQAIRLNPKHSMSYNNRCVARIQQNDPDRAMKDCSDAIRLDAKNAIALYNRGRVWAAKNDFEHAIADYSAAVRLDPRYVAALSNRGLAYERVGNYDKALDDFRAVVALNPQSESAKERVQRVERRLAAAPQQAPAAPATPESAPTRTPPTLVSTLAAMLTLTPTAQEDLAKVFASVKQHKALVGVPRTNRHWRVHERPSAELAEERALEGCQIWANQPCAVIAVNDRAEPADGKWPVHDMPRVHYNGLFDPERIPSALPSMRNRADISGYRNALSPKAAAFHPWGRIFIVTGAASQRAAEERALSECNADPSRKGQNGRCFLYAVADQVILPQRRTGPVTPAPAPGPEASQQPPVVTYPAPTPEPPRTTDSGPRPTGIPAAPPETRVALVIGNSQYANAGALPNARNDAQAIAAALRRIGFNTVSLNLDLSREKITDALKTFAAEADHADWAVVYYAGHGIEFGGTNFLIPTDARLASDRDISFEAVSLEQVLLAVEGAQKLRLVILDACRDNPFARSMRRTTANRSIGRGLARVEPEGATLVVYAARDGQVALDGEGGGNSPFATALAKYIETPGMEINFLFRKVRDDVLTATGRKQEPFVYGSLPAAEFYFRKP